MNILDSDMKLSIVIPVYNEERTICEILNKVQIVSVHLQTKMNGYHWADKHNFHKVGNSDLPDPVSQYHVVDYFYSEAFRREK